MGFILDFIKKYLSLIIPGSIVLLAVIILIPTFLIGSSVRKSMEDSLSQGRKVQSMINSVPSKDQFEQEKMYMDQFESEIDQISQFSTQSSQRELISYKIFPTPTDTSIQLFDDFGQDYRNALEELVKSINALDAPSDIELGASRRSGNTGLGMAGGYSRTSSSSRDRKEDPVLDAICRKRAEMTPVYANPNIFGWYDFWKDYDFNQRGSLDLAVEDCWYSQVAYWIYEDIIASVAKMNEGSSKVSDSAVKRIIAVSFSQPVVTAPASSGGSSRSRGSRVSSDGDLFVYVREGEMPLGVNPWTERVTDEKNDVIHFSFAVILESSKIIPFMRELCSVKDHKFREGFQPDGQLMELRHNQITVLNYNHETVERQDPEHLYYRYGDDPVVRLDLICEYIFSKKGYESIKPESIEALTEDGQMDR